MPIIGAIVLNVAAYFIGAIPFAYLLVRGLKGIDIRTVGSGNVGATNAARVLGLPFFFFIFALDFLKGFLPTWGFPWLWRAMTGMAAPPWLGVTIALATIIGHNFPIYLRFKGGKGVATSLGALTALEPVASGAAALGFVVFLLVTKYVSLSSLLGGLVFALVHFARWANPWDRDHVALSVLTIGLLGMLIMRHRKNLARIWAGTEPKVTFRRPRKPPAGGTRTVVVIVLTVIGALTTALVVRVRTPARLDCGAFAMVALERVGTGHQRAERLSFSDSGDDLAVTCPRYDRLVLYRVTADPKLRRVADVHLAGQPVAVQAVGDRCVVLERPSGDERHIKPGYWEEFDFQGRPVGRRTIVGFYPDDLALADDGRWAFVLVSGRAEGGDDRPRPALLVFRRDAGGRSALVSRLEFDGPKDDPARLALATDGRHAAVTLHGSDQVALVDLGDRAHPRIIRRTPLAGRHAPHPEAIGEGWIMMPSGADRESVLVNWPAPTPGGGSSEDAYLVETRPTGSALSVSNRGLIGLLPLRGPANLGGVRPTGLALAHRRRLLAVADRAGGVRLVALRSDAGDRPGS